MADAARLGVADRLRFDGRAAVITGGAGHIGRAIAAALAELGAAVVIVDRCAEEIGAVIAGLSQGPGTQALALTVDLEREEDVRAIPSRVVDALGRLDIVVNCAGLIGSVDLPGWTTPFGEQSAATWRRALEVNLTAPFVLTQAAAPMLAASGHGSVINIGSIYGMVGPDLRLYGGTSMGNPAAYAASKGGLLQLTRWLSTVLAPATRVNAISLGGVARNQPDGFTAQYIARTPLGRMATEQDVIGAAVYLAGDLSAYVTGHNLVVDGGWTAW